MKMEVNETVTTTTSRVHHKVTDLGNYLNGWCGHAGAKTRWADINGDGLDDIICDDNKGRHWGRLSNGDGTWMKDLK